MYVSQPIVIMGRRLKDMKGHFFSLLDERETEQVKVLCLVKAGVLLLSHTGALPCIPLQYFSALSA
jgi:hypothetical protein